MCGPWRDRRIQVPAYPAHASSRITVAGKGLLCLVGVQRDDNVEDAKWITNKILKTRVWEVDSKSWAGSVETLGLEVLLVSQFTLYGTCSKGTKPDFHRAMDPERARAFFAEFEAGVRSSYVADRVKSGVFGAMMDVALVNDGPVTLVFDSRNKKGVDMDEGKAEDL